MPYAEGSPALPAHPVPGTIFVFTIGEPVTMGPKEGRTLLFGRNRPEVHVCVAGDDTAVSRQQGLLTFTTGRWWLTNTGKPRIKVGESLLLYPGDRPTPMPDGYTSLLVYGTDERVHLVEVLIAGPDGWCASPRHGAETRPSRFWPLDPEERLALVVLSQEYLRNVPTPQPLSWRAASDALHELEPHRAWSHKKVEHLVRSVRLRLSAAGVPHLLESEVERPGSMLKHNLIRVLMDSQSVRRTDLDLIDRVPG